MAYDKIGKGYELISANHVCLDGYHVAFRGQLCY